MKGPCLSVVRFVQQSMGGKGNATIANPLPFSIWSVVLASRKLG